MPSHAYELVKDAIQRRKNIKAKYNGYVREMCPHVLGHKGGREQALMYQFAGGSSSGLERDGSPNNWRCVFLSQLRDVEVCDGSWHTASNHSRPQTCVDSIDVEVRF